MVASTRCRAVALGAGWSRATGGETRDLRQLMTGEHLAAELTGCPGLQTFAARTLCTKKCEPMPHREAVPAANRGTWPAGHTC